MTIRQPLILNVGPKEFSTGLSYTAASRTPDFTNLTFEPMPTFNRFLSIFNKTRFKEKEIEMARRQQLIEEQEVSEQEVSEQEVSEQEVPEQEVMEVDMVQETVELPEHNQEVEDSEELVLSQLSNISL